MTYITWVKNHWSSKTRICNMSHILLRWSKWNPFDQRVSRDPTPNFPPCCRQNSTLEGPTSSPVIHSIFWARSWAENCKKLINLQLCQTYYAWRIHSNGLNFFYKNITSNARLHMTRSPSTDERSILHCLSLELSSIIKC